MVRRSTVIKRYIALWAIGLLAGIAGFIASLLPVTDQRLGDVAFGVSLISLGWMILCIGIINLLRKKLKKANLTHVRERYHRT